MQVTGLQIFRPGYGWVLLGDEEKRILAAGDVLQVSITVPYKGPTQEFTLYGSIGQRGVLGFDEILIGRAPLACPESPNTFTPVEGSVDIPITVAQFMGIGGISPGTDYDLYVKIEEKPDVMAEIDDVIDITGGAVIPNMMGMFMMMLPLMMMGMVMPMITEGVAE